MSFTEKLWRARQSEFPNRRILTPSGAANTYDVSRAEGIVNVEGDGFTASNMNGLESRIAEAFKESGITIFTQLSQWNLEGDGINGRFKANVAGTNTSFFVGQLSYSVVYGDNTEIDIEVGKWYSFFLDEYNKTINFNMGGAALNYKVVGGTSQPTNPSENTIWLETDVSISDYSIEMENGFVSPISGNVWIKSDCTSPVSFSTEKKRRIEVFIGKAVQYVNNAWQSLNASIFQSGAWVAFSSAILTLIDTQAEYDLWTIEKASGGGQVTGVYDADEKTATLNVVYAGDNTVGRFAHPAINASSFATLNIDYIFPMLSGANLSFRIGTTPGGTDIYNFNPTTGSSEYRTLTVDLSGVSGEIYIHVIFWTNSGAGNTITLKNIYLT